MDDERDHRPSRWPQPALDVGVSLLFVALLAGALVWFVRNYGDESLSIPVREPPFTGTVTFDGMPLADATVIFAPTDGTAGSGATGVTDQSGRYRLKHLSDGVFLDGVLPGKYAVKFSRVVWPDGTVADVAKVLSETHGPIQYAWRETIPTDYSLKTAFTVDVEQDKRDGYDFALVTKE